MAVLQGEIAEQNYEKCRDRICQILTLEFADQYTNYNNDPALNATVYMERFVAFDKTEIPAINVCLSAGKYSNQDITQTDGSYEFYVDCYSKSKEADGVRGDTKATVQLHKMMGMVRSILEHPDYKTLGFAAPSISRVWVSDMLIPLPEKLGDGINEVHGRVVFNVEVPETVELKDGEALGGIDTQVKLYDTERGYMWGAALTNPAFINEDTEEEVIYFVAENGDHMSALLKFSELDEAPEVSALSSFVGIMDNGDGTFTNYLFTPAELAAYINAGSTKERITVATAGNTLTNAWFETHTVMEIVSNGQTYQEGEDFTQSGDTITGVTFTFYVGQKLIAKI